MRRGAGSAGAFNIWAVDAAAARRWCYLSDALMKNHTRGGCARARAGMELDVGAVCFNFASCELFFSFSLDERELGFPSDMMDRKF